MKLFIPTWSGDFRLDPAEGDEAKCILSIAKPTEAEKAQIKAFLAKAQERGWVDETLPRLTKRTVVDWEIRAPMVEAAPVLLEVLHDKDTNLWTGVKVASGKVTLTDTKPGLVQQALTTTGAVAAAVLRAPAVGCPAPEPCNVRASEVLATFMNPSQARHWNQSGGMPVIGHLTGQRYWLFHRNEAARRGLSHALVNEEHETVCAYHPTLPAEEEALALKLMVEHREDMLLRDFTVLAEREV